MRKQIDAIVEGLNSGRINEALGEDKDFVKFLKKKLRSWEQDGEAFVAECGGRVAILLKFNPKSRMVSFDLYDGLDLGRGVKSFKDFSIQAGSAINSIQSASTDAKKCMDELSKALEEYSNANSGFSWR